MTETFRECLVCAAKPGSPILCSPCIHNRDLIGKLSREINLTSNAIRKFAPDIAQELVDRWEAAKNAPSDLLNLLQDKKGM